MATVTISHNLFNTTVVGGPVLTLQAGDILNLLPGAGLYNYAAGGVGLLGGGSNSVIANGNIFSTVDCTGLLFTAGGNDINIGANATVLAQFQGIDIDGAGNNTVSVAGNVFTNGNAGI